MEAPDPRFTLLQAARIVARGSELDAKLDALCQHVLDAADAVAAVVYLYDPVALILVPAAQAGLGAKEFAKHGAVSADDPAELVAHVVTVRRPDTTDDATSQSILASVESAAAAAIPLLATDDTGGEEVEGVLLAAFGGGAPDLAGPENMLTALADLCAVAIRQARLQNALLERADWIGRLANTDSLTGLANEVTFQRMLELEIARATRQETKLSVLIFDIDDFAQVKTEAGGQAADEVLRSVAATLADEVRLIDTVARLGRDEFGLIAPGGNGEVAGRRVSEAMAQRPVAGRQVSVRVGVAVYPADGATAEELIATANMALAEAKRRGRGSIVVGGGS
jgi:diguanylate cyclase (GGDEF)-like protein